MTSSEKARQKIAFAEMDARIRRNINASRAANNAKRAERAQQAKQPSAAALPVACKPGSGGGCAVMGGKRRTRKSIRRR